MVMRDETRSWRRIREKTMAAEVRLHWAVAALACHDLPRWKECILEALELLCDANDYLSIAERGMLPLQITRIALEEPVLDGEFNGAGRSR